MTTRLEYPAPLQGPEHRDREPRPSERPRFSVPDPAVAVAVMIVVVLRLPALARSPGLDESGFLMVARQWSPGGSSLYGNYWVDRPPLLLTIFRLAALHGGLVTLRLLGCLAAAGTVVGVAHVASTLAARSGVAPRTAAAWAAMMAAAWLVTPVTGSGEVNGELLAAPVVAWGILAAARSLTPTATAGRAAAYAAVSGIAAVAALLVKQNFVDVAILCALTLLIGVRRGETSLFTAARFAAWFLAGASTALTVAAGWTMLRGTSLSGVLWAMYPFRVLAGHVIATSANPADPARLRLLVTAWLVSALGPVTVGVVWASIRHRRRCDAMVLALVCLVGFDVLSILLGGSFWSHYLVQLVVPLSSLLGVSVARLAPRAARVVAPMVAVAIVSLLVPVALPRAVGASEGSTLGRAVGAASQRGDTVVTLYGHSDVTEQSGLASPYPYLWSLPLKTLDPRLDRLDAVLTGPTAPTWVVTWARLTSWGVDPAGTARLLARDYHVAAVLHGHTVYVRDDVRRATPAWPSPGGR